MASIFKDIKTCIHLRKAELVLTAGMPRSGSTLLYNIVRLCLEQQHEDNVLAGWISDVRRAPARPVCLIKTHEIGLLYLCASKTFYSYRDIRDALVSSQRKFGVEPTIELCRTWIREDLKARKRASEVFRYEEITADKAAAVVRVANALDFDVDVPTVEDAIPAARLAKPDVADYDKQSLLHGGHATHTANGAWRTELHSDLLDRIYAEFDWWFQENCYES